MGERPTPRFAHPAKSHRDRLAEAIDVELRTATTAENDDAWSALERAHILSQPLPLRHANVHWRMLCHAFRHRDRKEITGQVLRLVVAAPASALGRYPVGNTGGANIRATATQPVPEELAELLAPFLRDA